MTIKVKEGNMKENQPNIFSKLLFKIPIWKPSEMKILYLFSGQKTFDSYI